MSGTPLLIQWTFRFRTDTSTVDTAATWAAAESVNYTAALETAFRVRIVVANGASATAAGAGPYILRVSKNAGAYTAVTTTSGATLGVQSVDAGASADAAVINTPQGMTTPGGGVTVTTGVYDETGSSTKSLAIGTYAEFEFGIILKSTGAAAGNTFDLRIYNSTTAFSTYNQTPRVTAAADTEDNPLANDVKSNSSVSPAPQLRQEHARLANDVKSNSSVGTPALAIVVPNDTLLADNVVSVSSVSQPIATILRGLLANDVKSNSSVSQPAAKALHGLTANDVKSNSSVGQPAAIIGRGLLANDITSGSSVSTPAIVVTVGQNVLSANDVLSASSVSVPSAAEVGAAAVIAPKAMHQYRMRRAA